MKDHHGIRMRVADFIAARLADHALDTCFLVTGGGAMHLNDAFGGEGRIRKVCLHHEQACAMAAEGYARITGRPAIVNVTTGPGGINALNGVFGAFTDSIPMVVVSGQVKRETLRATSPQPGLRQLGDQEVDILAMARPIVKHAVLLERPDLAAEVLEEAVFLATNGRPGPVWIDVPVDVQGTAMRDEDLAALQQGAGISTSAGEPIALDLAAVRAVIEAIEGADRPVVIAGSGVRIAGVEAALVEFVAAMGVPVVTAWTHDILPSDHPLYAGRPGTIGTRAGNFVVQNADLVVVLGSRLNIRQVSYNWASFARNARKVWVDIDAAEMSKPFVTADLPIVADLRFFLPALVKLAKELGVEARRGTLRGWREWCADVRARFEPRREDYPRRPGVVNAYHFVPALFDALRDDDVVACGDATACIVPFQCGTIRGSMRMFSNSGSASMGYDVPAAIGAAVADPARRVICLAGDGSIMMNVQELAVIAGEKLNVKVFVLDNDGYLSIKQTQRNFFGREIGASSGSGLHFPDFERLGAAFGLPSTTLDVNDVDSSIRAFLDEPGPGVCVVQLDRIQEFEPRLKSRMENGVIRTPELDDMYPFLAPELLQAVRDGASAIRRGASAPTSFIESTHGSEED